MSKWAWSVSGEEGGGGVRPASHRILHSAEGELADELVRSVEDNDAVRRRESPREHGRRLREGARKSVQQPPVPPHIPGAAEVGREDAQSQFVWEERARGHDFGSREAPGRARPDLPTQQLAHAEHPRAEGLREHGSDGPLSRTGGTQEDDTERGQRWKRRVLVSLSATVPLSQPPRVGLGHAAPHGRGRIREHGPGSGGGPVARRGLGASKSVALFTVHAHAHTPAERRGASQGQRAHGRPPGEECDRHGKNPTLERAVCVPPGAGPRLPRLHPAARAGLECSSDGPGAFQLLDLRDMPHGDVGDRVGARAPAKGQCPGERRPLGILLRRTTSTFGPAPHAPRGTRHARRDGACGSAV